MMHDYYIYSTLSSYVPSELMPSEQPAPEPEYTETQARQDRLITTIVALVLVLFNGAVLATAAIKFAQSHTAPATQTQQQQLAQWVAEQHF